MIHLFLWIALRAAIIGNVPSNPDVPVPFHSGESLDYELRFSGLRVGTGHMEVVGLDSMRGRKTWHTAFSVTGGTFFYKINDVDESWIDTETFSSLRFLQRHTEGGRQRDHEFEIYPERSTFLEKSDPRSVEEPSVQDPLDYASFLYFVRTIRLDVGQTYQFNRYFRPAGNPVSLTVLRRERVTVPAGRFNTIVIHPVIRTKGLFSDRGHAEVWLADDSSRIMVQLSARMPIGRLSLQLKSHRPGASAQSR